MIKKGFESSLYRNNLKSGESDKEAPRFFVPERMTIAEWQGMSEEQKPGDQPTPPKPDSSGCFGIIKKWGIISLLSIHSLFGLPDDKIVGFLTCEGFEEYKTYETKLIQLFENEGVQARFVNWKEEKNWDQYGAVFLFSVWDYCRKENLDSFRSVLEEIEQNHVPIYNSKKIWDWNHTKTYLIDLKEKGFLIPETVWLSSEELSNVFPLIEGSNKEWVLKPVISSGGNNTYRFSSNDSNLIEIIEECELLNCNWMLQPFLEEIIDQGEWSFIFIGQTFSHAVLKKPQEGNFLVQPYRGAVTTREEPETWMIEEAKKIRDAAPENVLYARVDAIEKKGQLIIMELELIEPHFYDSYNEDLTQLLFSTIQSVILKEKDQPTPPKPDSSGCFGISLKLTSSPS